MITHPPGLQQPPYHPRTPRTRDITLVWEQRARWTAWLWAHAATPLTKSMYFDARNITHDNRTRIWQKSPQQYIHYSVAHWLTLQRNELFDSNDLRGANGPPLKMHFFRAVADTQLLVWILQSPYDPHEHTSGFFDLFQVNPRAVSKDYCWKHTRHCGRVDQAWGDYGVGEIGEFPARFPLITGQTAGSLMRYQSYWGVPNWLYETVVVQETE